MKKEFKCKECGKGLDVFTKEKNWLMINNELWGNLCKKAGIHTKSHLCMECMERLNGKPFTLQDLFLGNSVIEMPMNYWFIKEYSGKHPDEVKGRLEYVKNHIKKFGPNCLGGKAVEMVKFIEGL